MALLPAGWWLPSQIVSTQPPTLFKLLCLVESSIHHLLQSQPEWPAGTYIPVMRNALKLWKQVTPSTGNNGRKDFVKKFKLQARKGSGVGQMGASHSVVCVFRASNPSQQEPSGGEALHGLQVWLADVPWYWVRMATVTGTMHLKTWNRQAGRLWENLPAPACPEAAWLPHLWTPPSAWCKGRSFVWAFWSLTQQSLLQTVRIWKGCHTL